MIKKLIATFVMLISILGLANAQKNEEYPTNFDCAQLDSAKNNIKDWEKKNVAFDILIVDTAIDGRKNTVFKGQLSCGETVWFYPLGSSDILKVGSKIRALSYFRKRSFLDPMRKVTNDKLDFLVFAMIDLKNKRIISFFNIPKQIEDWKNGIFMLNK